MFIRKNAINFKIASLKAQICERLSVKAIHSNAESHLLSHRFYNNLLIGKNYLATVMQYSKCYFCKLAFAKPFIRKFQGMTSIDQHIKTINNLLLIELPEQLSLLRKLGGALKYPQRNLHSALGLCLKQSSVVDSQVKYLAAIEAVTLGYGLHNSVGGSFNPNPIVRIGLTILRKVIKDKYLVLAGDYLHIRGSVLASEIGKIELPYFLSQAQISLSKQVYLRDNLRQKISKSGYESVSIKQIHDISRLRATLTINSLKGINTLQNERVNEELFQNIGLLVLYRRQLQEFMFNFPKLLHRFVQIKTRNGLFWQEYTLTQYLFFQSMQKTGIRLDLAYLNTVQMLKEEISILQTKIKQVLGEQQYIDFTRRIRYILMMYS